MKKFIVIAILFGLIQHVDLVSSHKTLEEIEAEVSETNRMMDEMEADLDSIKIGKEGQKESVKDELFSMPSDPKMSMQDRFKQFISHEPMWYWKYYQLEVVCLAVFVVAIIKMRTGATQNENIVQAWRKSVVPMLNGQFYHIGCQREQKSAALMQKSYTEFDYFASGRKNLTLCEFKLSTKHRQCLLSSVLYDPMYGIKDTVQIDIPLEAGTNAAPTPIEFYICKKKDIKAAQVNIPHLKEFVKNSNPKHYRLADSQLSDKNTYMINSEHDEITNQIISKEVGDILLNNGSSSKLVELHVTDQKIYNNCPLHLRAVIELCDDPTNQSTVEDVKKLTEMILLMADNIATLKMSSTVATKCEKARKKQKQVAQEQKKEEQAEKKADEKREMEKLERERMKRMTPEQLKKYEEKKNKKNDKKSKGKMSKVMKM